MDKKILTIILAIVLIGCFFLGYFGPATGLDLVQSSFFGWEKYVLILIPLSGVLLLIGALNNGNYPLGRNLLCWLPLLAVLFWMIGMPLINGASINDVFSMIGEGTGVGLWVTTGAALILALYNPKTKA